MRISATRQRREPPLSEISYGATQTAMASTMGVSPVLSGVTVQLWLDFNSNSILETGGPDTISKKKKKESTTTRAETNGFYLFAGVTASGD